MIEPSIYTYIWTMYIQTAWPWKLIKLYFSTTYHRTNPDGAVLSEGEEDDEEGDTGEGPRVSITINSSSDKVRKEI